MPKTTPPADTASDDTEGGQAIRTVDPDWFASEFVAAHVKSFNDESRDQDGNLVITVSDELGQAIPQITRSELTRVVEILASVVAGVIRKNTALYRLAGPVEDGDVEVDDDTLEELIDDLHDDGHLPADQ